MLIPVGEWLEIHPAALSGASFRSAVDSPGFQIRIFMESVECKVPVHARSTAPPCVPAYLSATHCGGSDEGLFVVRDANQNQYKH